MGAITEAWYEFKGMCKTAWGSLSDNGIDLGHPSGRYSAGGIVPEETRKFVRGTVYKLKLDPTYAREALSSITSLELLNEIIERQYRESKIKK